MRRSVAAGWAAPHGIINGTTPLGIAMRWLVLLLVLSLGGCGEGYNAPQAVIRLENSSVGDMDAAARAIASKLIALGFKEYPPEPRPRFVAEGLPPEVMWSDTHTSTFLRDGKEFTSAAALHVRVTPYPDANTPRIAYSTDISSKPQPPFLELGISELRSNGFSEEGIAIHAEIVNVLGQYQGTLVIPALPERGNDQAYAADQIKNFLIGMAWWLIAWAINMAIIGGLAMLALRKLRVRPVWRRAALILAGTLFVTPVPAPSIFVPLLVPNILLLLPPQAMVLVFQTLGVFGIAVFFGLSLALSTATAFLIVRDRPRLLIEAR